MHFKSACSHNTLALNLKGACVTEKHIYRNDSNCRIKQALDLTCHRRVYAQTVYIIPLTVKAGNECKF